MLVEGDRTTFRRESLFRRPSGEKHFDQHQKGLAAGEWYADWKYRRTVGI